MFNFVIESVVRKARIHRTGMMLMSDNIDIIDCTNQHITAALIAIKFKSVTIDLAVNERKTNYGLEANRLQDYSQQLCL